MTTIRKLTEWLSIHPTPEEIARAIVTEYLLGYATRAVRFGRINSDDSVVVVGQYGFADSEQLLGRVIPGQEWRAIDSDSARILRGETTAKWAPNSELYIGSLRYRGAIAGHMVVVFCEPIAESDKAKVAELVDDICIPISLYMSFMEGPNFKSVPGISNTLRASESVQLSQRQTLILKGMVEGKTNHELATELGYSVSTIRHETMRIYQALSVSDRHEAAKVALSLSLV